MASTGRTEHPSTLPPQANFRLIIDALADYANRTGIDLSKSPFSEKLQVSSSPDDILGLLEEHEKAFKEYREGDRRLIRCLSPVVTVIHAFSGILGEAVSLAPFPPAKAIFVGLDVLLAAATGVSSSYDALLELFECLTSFLKRLEIYTNIPPTTVMTDIILKIMVELLSVLALATKQINQGRFKMFARKLLGESEVEAVLQRLDRLTQDEARMTVAQTLGVVHGLMNNMKLVMDDGRASTNGIRQTLVALHQVVNEMNKMKRDQLQQEIQRWLSPPNPSTNHGFVSKARHKGTAAWFFEGNVLAEWKSRGSLLWIHGKPGSGKSTLLSAIIQDIEGMCAAGLASMAYYYFDFRDVKKQNIYGLLSSLLSQLSAELDSCHNLLSRLHSVNAGGARMPTSIALTGYIKDILSLPGQGPMYIVIDALDECPNVSGTPSAREEVLELVEGLVDLNLSNVYICVTSRPEIDIRMVLDPLKPLQISLHDESGQKRDIIEYVRSIVHSDRRMRRWREEDQKLVIDTLSEKADGMFRWVVCQIDRLRRNFPASIRGALDELPESLDQTYEQTLQGIDKEKRKYALRLFQCLSVSIRPLRVEELAEIVAVRFDAAGSSTFNPDWRPVDAEEAVLSACSSLIAIVNVNDSQVVQFSHFSVKEFLTSDRLATADEHLSYYHILPEPAHITLAHSCLSVLLQLDEKIDRNTIRLFPLSQYAAQYWIDHAQFRSVSCYVQDLMERLFDQVEPHFAAWIWLYDIDRHWAGPMPGVRPQLPEASPIYYASLCGFRGLVEHLIAVHPMHVNSDGGFHVTPLHAASVGGHSEVAQLLLSNDSAPNSCNDEGGTPLHIASYYGHLEIVKMLLARGVDVNQRKNSGEAPLHLASASWKFQAPHRLTQRAAVVDMRSDKQEILLNSVAGRGNPEIVRLLIDSGANVTVADNEGWTPLHTAAQYGQHDIAELLLLSGADLEARNKVQETPLDIACCFGRLAVSRLLLGRGADLNCREELSWTPLHSASRYRHLDVTKLLLERGADVNVEEAHRKTPLHFASDSGQLEIARVLIGHGAAMSPRDNEGWTPFHFASKYGHFHVAKFLLECGVDVDTRNGNEATSLYLASSRGGLDIVRFLVGKGADIHTRDNKGWNPLHIASQRGHLHVVMFLLECGVDVDIRNEKEETSLDLASYAGKLDVVRVLVEKGADIHIRDNNGWNPLHTASQCGHLDIVKFLLECGVDIDIRNGDQKTPLDLASGGGELDVAQFLVGQGADIHTRDNKGWDPLHIASHKGHLDVVRLLVDAGTAVDIRNGTQKTPLALALQKGEIEVSRFLIERGADLNTRDDRSRAPLHLASRRGHVEAVRLLLDCGVDLNIRDDDLSTPLHLASANGHLKATRLLVQRGAGLDFFDDVQRTPLDQAAGNGQVEIVRFLIDHGANLHTADTNGWTPLHASSRNGHLEVVKLLLRRGMELDVLDKANKIAAELASENDKAEVASFLAEYKADANVRNNIRSKTLDTAQIGADEDGKDEERASLHTVSKDGNVNMVKLLLDQGADINSRDQQNKTPLHMAAIEGHPNLALLLTERGAEVDSRDNSGWTPLHNASRTGRVEVPRVLLDHGADVNARTQDYWTPLHLSAYDGHLEVVRLLLGRGADVHVLNDEGETPHQLSMWSGYFVIADILKDHGASG